MTQAVQNILQRIQQLPEEDRLLLDEQLGQLAEAARRPNPPDRSQAELLAELRRRSHTLSPGTPDSVESLRQDRQR